MAMDASFKDLSAQLHMLREGLIELRTAVVEDKPLRDDVFLVDLFADVTDDLLGWVDEAISSAGGVRQIGRQSIGLDRASRTLLDCQELCDRIVRRFTSDLCSFERINELIHLGRERGGEWKGWANGVKEALDHCQQSLHNLTHKLFYCWQEVVERVETGQSAMR